MIKALAASALAFALVSGHTLAACENQSAPSSDNPRQPAPAPDPNPRRTGIGNVSLTFWLEQDAHQTVTTYNIGAGTHRCSDSCHWDETAKPAQHITATTAYVGSYTGRIHIQVVQNNNGRILCDANNDADRTEGTICLGNVVI